MRVVAFISGCLLAISVSISGCSPVGQSVSQTVSQPAPVRVSTPVLPTVSPGQAAREQLEHLLAEADLVQAQKVLREARGNGVEEMSLADLYETIGNSLLLEAQKEESANRYANAGKFYRLTMDVYPEDEQLQTALAMSHREISMHLEECADNLMKKGLAVYRGGDLEAAVDIWKRIREFYPEHSPSRVAISTAEKQLETLEKIAPAKVM